MRNAVTVNDSGPVLSAPNIRYELAAKTKAIAAGGIGAIHRLVQHIGLAACIDAAVQVFKIHQPYHASDHVLHIAYNILCGGHTLDDIELRRDTDFALTRALDRWTDAGVRFVFGYDATQTLVRWGASAPPALYRALVRRAERALQTRPRQRPARVKDRIVRERGFKHITTVSEAVVDFDYQPTACTRPYRVVALKKHLSVEKGEHVLFDDIRYFFYMTNDTTLSCTEVVQEARQRCDQENLIAQLKGGVRALHAPVNTLHANWAYMVMATLAWSLKAWVALSLLIVPRWRARHAEEQRRLLRMDVRTFLGAFVNVPCQIVTSGRRMICRLLAWNPWQYVFCRFVAAT